MAQKRSAFFISDRTAITAQMLGHGLLTQFSDAVAFNEITLPFVDSVEKAQAAVIQINKQSAEDKARALVFSSLLQPEVGAVIRTAQALVLDCFDVFMLPLEKELGVPASHAVGRAHGAGDFMNYHRRMEAVNYALSHDDGASTRDLDEADVILVGVSRCGKTPTCLYLAMQFGIRAANFPLIPEDFTSMCLPAPIAALRPTLYGLTINPERLHQIRSERRPGSTYAAVHNCAFEVREAEALMRQETIRYLDVTTKSIEELATTIMQQANLARRTF
jgi:regulator of PEP synthase PpsR (kinase-PPPase family)